MTLRYPEEGRTYVSRALSFPPRGELRVSAVTGTDERLVVLALISVYYKHPLDSSVTLRGPLVMTDMKYFAFLLGWGA